MARNPIVGGVGFELTVDDSKFIQQLRAAGERGKREIDGTTTAADRLADQLRQAGSVGERAMKGIADQTDRAGDLMARASKNAALLRNSVSAAFFTLGVISRVDTVAKFAQSISTLTAVSGAAGSEIEALRNKALQLGADTRFSATEAADAMTELARAGFDANEVLAAIGPTLAAAQASGAGIAQTAEIIGTTIRGFGIEAKEAARVADVLAQASNASNAGVVDLGEALKFAAPTAKALGLELEETVAVIGKLSDGGLKGGLAGRGFQSLGVQVVNNRKEVEKLIGSFNLAEEGLGGVIKRLTEAGITTEQVIKIFRAENLDTFGVLATAAAEGSLQNLEGLLDNAAGSSARAAAIMDDNLNGALQGLSSRIEALVIAIGDAGASAGLLAALDGLSALLKIAADNADVLQAVSIALAVKAIRPLAIALGTKAVAAVQALQAQLIILNAIAGRTTTGLTGVAGAGAIALRALGPMTLAVTAAAAAYVFLAREAVKAERAIDAAASTFDKYKQALTNVEDDTRALTVAQDALLIAIESQGPAAQATATAEVAAIQRRLTANEALAGAYQAQLAAQIAIAEQALDTTIKPVEVQGADVAGLRRSGASPKQIADAVDKYREDTREEIRRALNSETPLTPEQQRFAIADGERAEAEQRIKALRDAYAELKAVRRDEERDFATPRDFAGSGAQPFQKEIAAEQAKIKRLEETVRELERSGTEGAKRVAQEQRNQIAASARFIEELQRGIAPELARQIADAGRDQEAIAGALSRVDILNADIVAAQAAGRSDIVAARKEELRIAEETLALLQQGVPETVASEIAAPKKPLNDATDAAKKEAERAAQDLGETYLKTFETPIEALNRWRDEQLAAIALVSGSEERRAALREQLDAIYAERYDEIFVKEQDTVLAAVNAEAAKQKAIEDTLAARDAEIELQIAQGRGDEEAVKRLEAKADRQRRINELVSDGLLLTEATARADEEIARLKAGALSDAENARREFVDGLSGDISSALLNAVRSGDYGSVFQEVLNASAARGLEDAINQLADELANFAGNLIFGQNGAGGILGGLFGGAITPPILDPATAGAATGAVKGTAEAAAAASVSTLGAAAAGGAASVTALSAAETAGAASATALATALAAASLAAQAAASALAAVATSGGGSIATDVLSSLTFGGGRAKGGPVVPGKFYEVNEGGLPELLSMGSRKFLLPGSSGEVTPLAGSTLPAPASREVARHEIYVQGTGNAEIQRAVDLGVQRSIKIARAQAGPAAAEFQTRKV